MRGAEKPSAAQRLGDRHERLHVLGQMRNCAIGFAVAHRWSVGPARRVHENEASLPHPHTFVEAGGCIAGQMFGDPARVARLVEKAAARRQASGASFVLAKPADTHLAELGALLRKQREGHVPAILRQDLRGALRPLQ